MMLPKYNLGQQEETARLGNKLHGMKEVLPDASQHLYEPWYSACSL